MPLSPFQTHMTWSFYCIYQQEATADENLLGGVRQAAQNVTDALNNLLQRVRDGSRNKPGGQYDSACDDILNATDRLFNSMGNAGEMVKQAKILALVSIHLWESYILIYLYRHTTNASKIIGKCFLDLRNILT